MKKFFLITALFLFIPLTVFADEDVQAIYAKVEPKGEVVAVNNYGNVMDDIEYLLIEVERGDIEEGNYEVEVTRVDEHIYKIDGTGLFLKMKYCYDYSYRDRAILKVRWGYSGAYGTLIWVED